MISRNPDIRSCQAECERALYFVNEVEDILIPRRFVGSEILTYKPTDYAVDLNNYEFSVRLNKPIRAMVFLTNKCCTNCIYCYAERRKCDEMAREDWAKLIDQFAALRMYVIDMTGGDVFARNDSIDIILDMIRANFVFLISTKCRLERKVAERLADNGFCEPVNGVFRRFQVSLDAAKPEIAALLTGTSRYFENAKTTITNLLAAGISPQVKAVLTPLNFDQVEPLVETFLPIGITQFAFSVYGRSGYRHNDEFFLNDDNKKVISTVCDKLVRKYPEIDLTGDAVKFSPTRQNADERKESWDKRAGCSGGFSAIGVAPDGKVILCEQIPQRRPFVVGDLRTQSIMEVWNSEGMADFINPNRNLFRGTICYDCEDFEPCHEKGWCYRDALFAFANPFGPPPNCPFVENPPRMR